MALNQRALQLDRTNLERRGCAASRLHEGQIADPELVVHAGGSWAGGGAEQTAEEIVVVAGEAGLFHGALQGRGVGFQQHGAQLGLMQGSGGTAQHLGFVTLHIHLANERGGLPASADRGW